MSEYSLSMLLLIVLLVIDYTADIGHVLINSSPGIRFLVSNFWHHTGKAFFLKGLTSLSAILHHLKIAVHLLLLLLLLLILCYNLTIMRVKLLLHRLLLRDRWEWIMLLLLLTVLNLNKWVVMLQGLYSWVLWLLMNQLMHGCVLS